MIIKIKDNGYKAEALQKMIALFNTAAEKVFGDCEVEHFYYGDTWDMADIRLPNGNYGHFNIGKDMVTLSGYTASCDNYERLQTLTLNDKYCRGYLLEIAQ